MWQRQDPVQIGKGISLPRFVIEKYSSDYCNVKTSTGKLNNAFSLLLHILTQLTVVKVLFVYQWGDTQMNCSALYNVQQVSKVSDMLKHYEN